MESIRTALRAELRSVIERLQNTSRQHFIIESQCDVIRSLSGLDISTASAAGAWVASYYWTEGRALTLLRMMISLQGLSQGDWFNLVGMPE
jgi:hypothetical protein